MHQIRFSKAYKKSIKKLVKSGAVTLSEVDVVVNMIVRAVQLPAQYRDHKLTGELQGYRECHIRPDVLLVYMLYKKELVVLLVNVGSHSELFA